MAAAAHLRRLRQSVHGPVTLGELTARLGREGIGLLVFLGALPFLQPIPLAGLGTPIGLLLAALGLQLARGRAAPALPKFIAAHALEKHSVDRLFGAAEKAVAVVERFAHPRWPLIARSPRLLGASVVVLGLIFAVPIFVPFGNPITASALLLLGLGLLEDDGVLGALGVAGTGLALAFHAAFLVLLWNGGHAFLGRR
jgi:hypothetical protein